MAILCTNCGTSLPNDDAKFCNVCGTLTPSHPYSSRSTLTPAPAPTLSQNNVQMPGLGRLNDARPPMREQIAHLPQHTDRPVRRFVQDEPPSWMSRLDAPASASPLSIAPAPAGSNLLREQKQVTPSSQLDFPVSEPLPHPNSPSRELRVKVWQQQDPISSPGLPGQDIGASLNEDMDNLPTSPLVASPPNPPVPRTTTSAPIRPDQHSRVDELERMDTARLAVPPQRSSSQFTMQPLHERSSQLVALPEQQTASLTRGAVPRATIQDNAPTFTGPAAQPVPALRATRSQQTPPPHASVSASPARRKRGRKPVVFVVGLLVILLLGGIGAWIGITQPFSVPTVTQPQQTFTNSQLAFSLQYPRGWNAQVDSGKAIASFVDTSNTAQFTVALSQANGKDAGQYVQQLATHLKMTNIKSGTSLSFAGASWQQIQGNVLFSGANYSETILATVHNNQLYTITQAAPQSTYAQEDQIVFSPMRLSFKFV